MAFKIWLEPDYFPPETRESAVTWATRIFAAHGVTLAQAADGYADFERYMDAVPSPSSPVLAAWEEVWNALRRISGTFLLGIVLVLDEKEPRFSMSDDEWRWRCRALEEWFERPMVKLGSTKLQ